MNHRVRWNRIISLIVVTGILSGACNLLSLSRQETATSTPAVVEEVTQIPEETQPPTAEPSSTEPPLPFTLSQGPRFAAFEEFAGTIVPMSAQEPIAVDLSNVRIPFLLSQAQRDRLVSNGFVVSPGSEREFFTVYEKARYDDVPIFVTSDSLLHVYHLMFSKTLREAEAQHFIPLLQRLNQVMLAKSDEIYQQLQGNTEWSEAAMRLVAYFGVGSKLLNPAVQVPAYADALVQQEMALIESADGMHPSPIFPLLENGEDYTQYIPRGHYTRTEALKAYFKSMMWYGRMTFRLKGKDPNTGKFETRSAILLTFALRNAQVDGKPALDAWADLYAPTVFFVGRSDDLTVVQYGDVVDYVYGAGAALQSIADEAKLDSFINEAWKLPPPKILGIVIMDTDNVDETTKGLRFMGQRFVPDAYIFRELIYRNVGTSDNRRGLPKGLDLFAAMGSERAYQLLDQMGETKYENYPQQMDTIRSWLQSLGTADWTETLYNTWLYTFFPLIEPTGEGYPQFMRNISWVDKQLNTSLGSWAELKHDTILYAKQVYAELGGGPPPPPPLPPRGYVEPVPLFYARLAALTSMTRKGLETRGLLSEADKDGLTKLEDLASALQVMAGKELRGESLTEDEFERIRYIGGELEHLTMLAAESETTEAGAKVYLDEEQQAAVIADVATDPGAASGPVVLEVSVGRINEIYVVTPIVDVDGTTYLQVAKGGVFAYYEFPWPASDRLTDEKWRQMLDSGQAPALPDWTASFVTSETENVELRQAVHGFQNGITYIYWDPIYSVDSLAPAQQPWRAELQALNAQKQYIGHQLYSVTFRSFDFQSPTLAVVTTRETWQDKLYAYSGDYPDYYSDPELNTRGPYAVDLTYTLEFVDGQWTVRQVVYNTQPPGW
jgi:hypothetical protein